MTVILSVLFLNFPMHATYPLPPYDHLYLIFLIVADEAPLPNRKPALCDSEVNALYQHNRRSCNFRGPNISLLSLDLNSLPFQTVRLFTCTNFRQP
jgi:hypothetical protein